MVFGEDGLVGLAVVLLVEVVHIQEQDSVITQPQQMAETPVLDPLRIPRAVILMVAHVSEDTYMKLIRILDHYYLIKFPNFW